MKTFFSKRFLCILSLAFYFVGIYAIEETTHIPKKVENILNNVNLTEVKDVLNNTRRIVVGTESKENRPYMVYLKLPSVNPKFKDYRKWLCGGVIIHEEYILTSAACIEDARHFYIVSGTFIYDEDADRYNNPCIKNGAKKAVWKCVPRNYMFDGHENDNIRWMNNDIAIIKTEDEFDFTRRIRGCDYIPRPICYNNQSQKLEEPDNGGFIAGWGSTHRYNEPSTGDNTKRQLLETEVRIIGKSACKKRWGKRYHNIIDNYMICTKDIVPDLSEICSEKYVDCTDISYESEEETRRFLDPEKLELHSAFHNTSGLRRQQNIGSGGFCENDHGGPLITGSGGDSIVIGIISACLVKEGNNRCYGPFLYTSVWRNRHLINCAIFKSHDGGCDKLFRAGGTHTEEVLSWSDHPDGPAKNEAKTAVGAQKPAVETENTAAIEPAKVAAIEPAKGEAIVPKNEASIEPQKSSILEPREPAVEPLNGAAVEPNTGEGQPSLVQQRRQLETTTGKPDSTILTTTLLPLKGGTLMPDKALGHSGIVLRSTDDSALSANKTVKNKV